MGHEQSGVRADPNTSRPILVQDLHDPVRPAIVGRIDARDFVGRQGEEPVVLETEPNAPGAIFEDGPDAVAQVARWEDERYGIGETFGLTAVPP